MVMTGMSHLASVLGSSHEPQVAWCSQAPQLASAQHCVQRHSVAEPLPGLLHKESKERAETPQCSQHGQGQSQLGQILRGLGDARSRGGLTGKVGDPQSCCQAQMDHRD